MKPKNLQILFLILFFLFENIKNQKCNSNLCYSTSIINGESISSCITPTSTKLSSGDGGECLTACEETSKCILKGAFICINRHDTVAKQIDGSNECYCSNSSYCLNKETNQCILKGTGLSTDSNGFCQCTDTSMCFSPYSPYNCLTTASGGFISTTSGNECLLK